MKKRPHALSESLLILLVGLLVSCSLSCDLLFGGSDDSAYAVMIHEYVYGPGQHAQLTDDNGPERFLGAPSSGSDYVLLGGWGGYIIAGFDHPITDQEARHQGYDFAVYPQSGTGSEPGVLFVMSDENGNGLPDDTWYEIAGSESEHAGYERSYTVRYYRPEAEQDISWTDSLDRSGELSNGNDASLTSSWWWDYESTVSAGLSFARTGTDATGFYCEFSGVLLPDSKVLAESTGIWSDLQERFSSGYAEVRDAENYHLIPCGDSTMGANLFDIADAIDEQGAPADLESIDFIRVQTGVFQQTGWLNEVSTEVCGAADLSLLGDFTL